MVYDRGSMNTENKIRPRSGEDGEIGKEVGIHGDRWASFHRGYFSNPEISQRLIDEVGKAVNRSRPTVLIDMGGGTGFLLSQLLKRKIAPGIALINLDLSSRQLLESFSDRIANFCVSITNFKRDLVASDSDRVLFMMRSVLHYFGEIGLPEILSHLREQMKAGEYFIHQTACFDSPRSAECLNRIYDRMGTAKWYPTVAELISHIETAGWKVTGVSEAPPLCLNSFELKERYRLSEETVKQICREITENVGEIEGIYRNIPQGFIAHLPYNIFRCLTK